MSSWPSAAPTLEQCTGPCAARIQREAEKRKGSDREEHRIVAVGGVLEPDDMSPGRYLHAHEAWRHHLRLRAHSVHGHGPARVVGRLEQYDRTPPGLDGRVEDPILKRVALCDDRSRRARGRLCA